MESSSQHNSSEGTAPEQQPTPDQQQHQQEDFIATSSFTGARVGYIFTTGDRGTGFYKDVPLHLRPKTAAKAKPAVLNSSSLVKGLKRRPGNGQADPKKRKTESDSSKPAYLREMDKYHAMNCSSNTQHDRPLVK